MKTASPEIIIIGAGLTGLTLAYLLRQNGLNATVLEARKRVGGRIHNRQTAGGTKVEMGATWLGSKHQQLRQLLAELGLGTFAQFLGTHAIYEPISTSPPQLVTLPANDEPSYRIQGGTSALIEALAATLDDAQIVTGQVVESIWQETNSFLIVTQNGQYPADLVVSTLPPFLLKQTIAVSPTLPVELLELADKTHTWMGESIKVGLTYARPFWRESHTSGTIFSSVGPVGEMYDHSDDENAHFALKGFLNGAYAATTREQRMAVVTAQLQKYYGAAALDYLTYEETVWSDEPFTYFPYRSQLLPHQNNGQASYREPLLNGQFFLAGAETAPGHPGYMDGAVESARITHQLILQRLDH